MSIRHWSLAALLLVPLLVEARSRKGVNGEGLPPLDRYVMDAESRAGQGGLAASPGSLYGGGRMADLVRDQRAYQLDDIVTILVSDRASAIARGVTSTSRKSNAGGGITALAGPLKATGALANLAGLGGEEKLDGQGQTSRETQLSTTLAARVVHVLPNGYLVLEGTKDIAVNAERQKVIVRGVCRPQDLGSSNIIRSDRLAQLEVRVDGKGVVGDAVRRPFILFRILNGLLPF
ncbi:MAG: flagellar basal body L-ring protein FlgH [Bryobacteraceae bacterium]|nr:flagellar basal body L-ring protein FlgH [Bryobacteraceae bacterium]